MSDFFSDTWKIWIDRGTTFTDIVASNPRGAVLTHKLLSEDPEQYSDAAVQGIEEDIGCVKRVKQVKNDEIKL